MFISNYGWCPENFFQKFNPAMATAAKVVIAEVENIVGVGSLNPNEIHTQGIYVDRIVKGGYYAPRF